MPPHIAIDRRLILSIFLIIPVLTAAGYINYSFFSASWLPHMRVTSLFLPLYLLFFELPHIIASFVGFFDTEYVRHYRIQLFYWLPLVLTTFTTLFLWSPDMAITIYLVGTMYHVMRQQTGISLMFGVAKNIWYHIWSWWAIILTATFYLTIGAPNIIGFKLATTIRGTTIFALFIFTIISVYLTYKTKTTMGRIYILATLIMLIASYSLFSINYLFLGIFIVRFIHDTTAFLFYVTHEVNRNWSTVNNWLYKRLPFLPKTLFVFIPLFSISVGLTLRFIITDAEAIFLTVMLMAVTHYYLESIMWKRHSLHRNYVRVN